MIELQREWRSPMIPLREWPLLALLAAREAAELVVDVLDDLGHAYERRFMA